MVRFRSENEVAIEVLPEEDLIEELLISDQDLYAGLAQANEFISNIRKLPIEVPLMHPADTNEFKAYEQLVSKIQSSFLNRQKKLQETIPDDARLDPNLYDLDALTEFTANKKQNLIDYFNVGLDYFGIGLAVITTALAIIAVTLITIAITTAIIVDMLTDSTEEREALIRATLEMKEQFGLSDSEFNKLMKETSPRATGVSVGIGGLGWVAIGLGGYILYSSLTTTQK